MLELEPSSDSNILSLQTTDNNCGKFLQKCIVKDAQIKDIYNDLSNIANFSLRELIDKNKDLLIFPKNLSKEEGVESLPIFTMQGSSDKPENIKIFTNNIMGFVGIGNTQLAISSRFETGKDDFFLYYLLQKVCALNLFDLKFSSGDGFWNFLLFLFPQFLNRALLQGIFRTYRTFKRNDANVKGPIDISRHIKENIPFMGKIAYSCREFSVDNYLTELIRHTIEVIKITKAGKNILSNNEQTRHNIDIIISATPTYSKHQRDLIIKQNIKPFNHPYFTEYRTLQKLCLAILRHKKLQYGSISNKIYGILFDGAWLWEEYLAKELKELNFTHSQNKIGSDGINLWKGTIYYPDLYRGKQNKEYPIKDIPNINFILDAKYKRLNNGINREDINQTITYMHILPAKYGGLIYPYPSEDTPKLDKKYEIYGLGGKFYTFGIKIPQGAKTYQEFCELMKNQIQKTKQQIQKVLNENV